MNNHGEAIRFSGGKYKGETGWFDALRPSHPKMMYNVIVDREDGAIITKVKKESVKVIANDTIPVTAEEAVLNQHPDVEEAMDKLVAKLARCWIRPESTDIHRIFQNKLAEAWSAQTAKGGNALWRYTEFKAPVPPPAGPQQQK
jgi:hypothetical protein